jgi:hypothetical protein
MNLKMISKEFCLLLPLLAGTLLAQSSPLLNVTPPDQVVAKHGATVTVKLTATLNDGFHLNSHTPDESYLIPLALKWTDGALASPEVQYPAPQIVKVPFQEKPLSVLTGKFELTTKFKVPASAPTGPSTVMGKLRYQACNDKSCFAPKTVDVKIPVQVQ